MAAQKVWLPNFPAACFGEKLGLKLPKHLQDVITFVFCEACVDS